MKISPKVLFVSLLAVVLSPAVGNAQTYSINWHKVAGGGGTSTNSQFALSGTIGQPDAGPAMTAGGLSVTGGFWSLVSGIPTEGLPTLVVTRAGSTVHVSWADTGAYTLQQTANLAATNSWSTSGFTITTSNGTNSISITAPNGSLFFRLKAP